MLEMSTEEKQQAIDVLKTLSTAQLAQKAAHLMLDVTEHCIKAMMHEEEVGPEKIVRSSEMHVLMMNEIIRRTSN